MPDFDYHKIDSLIHSRIRLAVISILVGVESSDFTFLQEKVKATDGNLSVHLSKLESAGYVTVTKKFIGKKPQTSYAITAKGKKAFNKYLSHIEKIISGGKS